MSDTPHVVNDLRMTRMRMNALVSACVPGAGGPAAAAAAVEAAVRVVED